MKHLRALIAVSISICLVTLSPGLGAYNALASVVGSAATAAKAGASGSAAVAGASVGRLSGVSNVSVLPVSLNFSNTFLPSSLSPDASVSNGVAPVLPQTVVLTPSQQPTAGPVSQASALIASPAASPSSSRAPPKEAGKKRAALDGLKMKMPDFGKMSGDSAKSAAAEDFLSRIGQSEGGKSSSEAVAPKASFMGAVRRMVGLLAFKKKSDDKMPDYGREDEGPSSDTDYNDLDELGNPRRKSSGGPDDATGGTGGFDENGGDGGRGNSDLFGFAPVMLAGSALFITPILTSLTLPMALAGYFGLVLPSLILHEMGHAWAAGKLGDPTPKLKKRLSFHPKNLWNHVSMPIDVEVFGFRIFIPYGWSFVLPVSMIVVSMMTVGVPLFLGGARPVRIVPDNTVSPARGRTATKGMALAALAGPVTNLLLAGVAAGAHLALVAAGVTGAILPLLAVAVWLNVFLAVFNLIPFFPFDGNHIARSFVADKLGRPDVAQKFYGTPDGEIDRSAKSVNLYGLLGTIVLLGSTLVGAVDWAASLMLSGSAALSGVQTAAAALPALGALGLMAGWLMGEGPQAEADPRLEKGAPSAHEISDSTDLIIRFPKGDKHIIEDAHLSLVDTRASAGISMYQATTRIMSAQLKSAGLDMQILGTLGVSPVATYKRINAATLRMPAASAQAVRAMLEARGVLVYENERREIVRPIEDDPNIQKPQAEPAWGEVSMKETLEISTMDKVHEEARKLWGSPQATGWRARLLNFLLKTSNMAQPNIGVIDTGVDKEHRLIKPGLKAAKDVDPNGDGVDGNGHGTWVTSMVLWFAPWLKNITHYKIFGNGGGATLDDVLKGLTMAGNDDNIIISNSWGSNDGDPNSPDSLMVKKLAEEGRVMVFAAGNNGYSGRNTIGSPAISHYVDPETKAPRVIAVAATDRKKAVTRFSSKGPGSRKTNKDYPRKPDAAEQGDNTEGAWPGGRTRAISGTSMSTPKFAGTLAMLAMLFGVTKTGADLDRVVNAVMGTLINPQQEPETAIGDGFSAAYAAYQQLLSSGFVPVKRGLLRRMIIWLLDKPAA